jgi:integrase
MKGKVEHRVPLSKPALALLGRMKTHSPVPIAAEFRDVSGRLRHRLPYLPDSDLVFPSPRNGRESTHLLTHALQACRTGITVHGFRSTFRDWAAGTHFAREDAELSLAHTVADATEGSYWRGDNLEKRRALMEAWAQFCAGPYVAPAGQVVSLHPRAVGE